MKRALLVLVTLCALVPCSRPAPEQAAPSVRVFFGPKPADAADGILANLLKFLDTAKETLHGSIHEIDMIVVAEKLAAKSKEGVVVDLILEKDWWNTPKCKAARQILEKSKVKIQLDNRQSGLMHNKFVVADRKRVWTGSTNFTETCLLFNLNDAVWVESPDLAERYHAEFEAHRNAKEGHARAPRKPAAPIDVGDIKIQPWFSPVNEPLKGIVAAIQKAEKSIDVMCFVFSSKEIAAALKKAHERGANVRVLLDDRFASPESTVRWPYIPFHDLKEAGIACKYDNEPSKIHHKFAIVDSRVVIVGSFNLSTSANKDNNENLLVVTSAELAKTYETVFQKWWDYYDKSASPIKVAPAKGRELRGTVVKVLDGNTIRVRPDGQRKQVLVRLDGVSAPKRATRDLDGQEPWGARSQQHLSRLITGKDVRVEVVAEGDAVKGSPAFVWLGDRLLNEEMLSLGHALLSEKRASDRYADRLKKAETDARGKKVGVWDEAEPLPESPDKYVARNLETESKRKDAEKELALKEFQQGCVVGNKTTKKYHVPGGRNYDAAKSSTNAVFFRNTEDAEKAGYTPAKR